MSTYRSALLASLSLLLVFIVVLLSTITRPQCKLRSYAKMLKYILRNKYTECTWNAIIHHMHTPETLRTYNISTYLHAHTYNIYLHTRTLMHTSHTHTSYHIHTHITVTPYTHTYTHSLTPTHHIPASHITVEPNAHSLTPTHHIPTTLITVTHRHTTNMPMIIKITPR